MLKINYLFAVWYVGKSGIKGGDIIMKYTDRKKLSKIRTKKTHRLRKFPSLACL